MGTVKIVGGRYVPEGAFHVIEPGTPIRDETGELHGVTKPRNMTYMHSYGGEAFFFQAVSDKGRLLATRCDNPECKGHGSMYLPFRIYCPDCLRKNIIVDVTTAAMVNTRIYTYIVTSRTGAFNTLKTPIRFVDLEFPGSGIVTLLKGYMVGPGQPAIGLHVVPVFRTMDPTYTIQDLAWVLEGTPTKDLPPGFRFAHTGDGTV